MTYLSSLKASAASAKGLGRRFLARAAFLKKKRWYIPLALLFVGAGSYLALAQPKEPDFETAVVSRQDVVQVVSQTGTVEPAEAADLSFTGTGRIERVYVEEGQAVRRGQLIASLESRSEYANLLSARARLKQQEATYQNADTSLEQTRSQQDRLVENARLALLREDLQAYLVQGGSENISSDHTPPTITGTYRCDEEGAYRITMYASGAQSGATLTYNGIEEGKVSASTIRPVPLGDCGLYIQFPDDFFISRNIVWEIAVPNKRSATYQARLNAYNAAVENRRLTITETRRTPILSAQIEEARAAVLAAEAAFADTRLVAPFAGIVTRVDATRGAIASPGTPAVSLVSTNAFEIRVSVPEDDISQIEVGDRADVSFDAYDDTVIPANVSFISPQATTDSGAVAFEVTLQFAEQDDRIRAGLSADVDIVAAERKDVVAVPTRAVIEEEDGRYVRLMASDVSYRKVAVTTGLSGSGYIEITSGLTEGDRIITFANEDSLAALTEEQ